MDADIFDRGLLILLPFYIFSHEKNFPAYNCDAQKLAELKADYREIMKRLQGQTAGVSQNQ